MHELGIVIQIVKTMEKYMEENNISKIDTLVLQVGELSGVYPRYLEDVYPIAVEYSKLKDTKLKLDVTPGIGQCLKCGFNYALLENNSTCPLCSNKEYSVITGKDFIIKEIHV
jgi:hydrogenase nickel incorporation protein HypA/HybF